MESYSSYPDTLIGNFMSEKSDHHSLAVKAYAEKIKARRAAEMKGKQDKITERLRKKEEKAAKKKAEEIARLREEIKEKYVDKVTPTDEILKQDITEIDGWSQDGKPVVTAIGGWLG